MNDSGLGGGRKEWARLFALIAIQDAKVLASPQLYLDKMSKRCLELQLVLEQVEDALLGVDCLFSDEEPPLNQSIRDLEVERNAKALKILRDWHRRTDRHDPVPLSPPSAEQ